MEIRYAPRRDAVGNIAKLVFAVEVDKVLHNGGPDELRMKLSDTIDLVRANDSKIGHADVLRLTLLDQRHLRQFLLIARELAFDGLEECPVDIIDNLEVPGKELLHERDRPSFQSLRQHSMVGEGKGLRDNVPGVCPVDLLLYRITSDTTSILVVRSLPSTKILINSGIARVG
jgi:hypothetical protein